MEEEYESVWQALIDMGLSEEDLENVMRLAEMQGGLEIAQGRLDYADPREVRWPKGRWAGRIYRHAHPLEHLSAGVDKTIAGYERKRAIERQEQLLQEIRNARINALKMGSRRATGTTPTPGTPNAARTYPYGGKAGTPTTGWVSMP